MEYFEVIETDNKGKITWSSPLVPEFVIGKLLTELDPQFNWENNIIESQLDTDILIKMNGEVFNCMIIYQTSDLYRFKTNRLCLLPILSQLTKNSEECIVVYSRDGSIAYVDPKYADFLEYEPEELFRRNCFEIIADGEQKVSAIREFSLVLDKKVSSGKDYYYHLSKSGVPKRVLVSHFGFNSAGFAVCLVTCFRKKESSEIDPLFFGGVNSFEEIDEFDEIEHIEQINHDIRNVMNSISGSLQLMNPKQLSSDNLSLFKIINCSVEAAIDILESSLDETALSKKRLIIKISETPIKKLLDNVLISIKGYGRTLNWTFSHEIDKDLPDIVIIDGCRVKEILFNYLTNAIKYSTGKSIKIRASLVSDQIRFTVSDTGPGIKNKKYLFIKHRESVDIIQQIKSAGIGLNICREIAEKMGGSVGCLDNADNGSDFYVQVPFEIPSDDAFYTQKACHKSRSFEQDRLHKSLESLQQPLDVVVVEDNILNMKILVKFIEKLGGKCRTASNGKEGLILVQNNLPDVIITDINMPGMNGIEMLENCKDLPGFKDVLLIVTSADRIDNMDAHILKKPIKLRDLGELLNNFFFEE